MDAKGDARVVTNDGIVQFNAEIDEFVGIVTTLAIPLTHLGIEQRRVLGSIDLDIGTTQANQFIHFTTRKIHDISKIGIAGGIGSFRLLRVAVVACLLGADDSYLRWSPTP